jgi:glycosyltransferase involved in cell wall biosynthesis
MRIAIVHEWCVTYGGAERVLERLLDLYPDAEVFTLIDKVPLEQRGFLRGKTPRTTFFQRIPRIERHYRKLLALMPYAMEQFDLSVYDLILSSHYSVAKGVITGPRQLHICYCHSPMRYAWDMQHSALTEEGLNTGLKGLLARVQLHRIRQWDARTANNVDFFIANSKFIADRIWRCYRRESTVIPPPVDVGAFQPSDMREDFYLSVGRLVPYKKIDLMIEAFRRMPDRKLVVVGSGPELDRLRALAPANVQMLGRREFAEVIQLMGRARALIFAAYEDFGIVPLETQACGTPVLAYGAAGSLETVIGRDDSEGRPATGHFFYEQSAQAIERAVGEFEALPATTFTREQCRQHALAFSPEIFAERIRRYVNECWKQRRR